MIEKLFIFVIIFSGIVFPVMKLPILWLILQLYSFDRIKYKSIPNVSLYVYDNYILLQIFSLFGSPIFFGEKLEFKWFTLFSIIYNMIVYQSVLLVQLVNYPILSVIITSVFQYLDGMPLVFSVVDNLAVTYCYQGIIIDGITILFGTYSMSLFLIKMVFYVICCLI